MSSSLRHSAASAEVQTLDSVRPTPAKASLRVHDSPSALRSLIAESIRAVSSQKAAAIDMQIDASQLARQLKTGHLTVERLEALGPQFLAELGDALIEEYGALTDPKSAARKSLDAIEQEVRQLRQFVEQV
jgi:hypothetical protein